MKKSTKTMPTLSRTTLKAHPDDSRRTRRAANPGKAKASKPSSASMNTKSSKASENDSANESSKEMAGDQPTHGKASSKPSLDSDNQFTCVGTCMSGPYRGRSVQWFGTWRILESDPISEYIHIHEWLQFIMDEKSRYTFNLRMLDQSYDIIIHTPHHNSHGSMKHEAILVIPSLDVRTHIRDITDKSLADLLAYRLIELKSVPCRMAMSIATVIEDRFQDNQ